MVENHWQSIWNKRKTNFGNFANLNDRQIVLELKRLDGFDVDEASITYEAFVDEGNKTVEYLSKYSNNIRGGGIQSLFEVGCGSGANLYMFSKLGIQVGGIDYSKALIEILKKVPTLENLRECICDEAINMPTDIKYDSVVSTSVFHYFYDLNYANSVLKKMLDKTNYSLGILHIHDEAKKNEFLNFRRQLTTNYDELYKGLPNLFYNKEFFTQFGKENNLRIEFADFELEDFWNNPYIYNCFMYKRN